MKLRSNIRPPERYESECTSDFPTRKRTRNAAPPKKNYIDFNPNLPPAAFPTLDNPRPAGQTRQAETVQSSHDFDSEDGSSVDQSLQNIDNFVASNGPQNPQYTENMARLDRDNSPELTISENDDTQAGFENTIDEDAVAFTEEYLLEDPTWRDLSLSLQIEIAENMLAHHHLSKVQMLLGLDNGDVDELRQNLQKQNEDIEYENEILEEMRNKQLRALMCLDNSDLKKYSVPARLIMSKKSWARCHRAVQKNSKMQYLLCQAGDLLLARRFLSKRGLPLAYAGDWDNDYVATPSLSEDIDTQGMYTWRLSPRRQEAASASLSCDELRMDMEDAISSNHLHRLDTQEVQQTGFPSSSQPGYSESIGHMPSSRRGLVRLKIGSEKVEGLHGTQHLTPNVDHTNFAKATFSRLLQQTKIMAPNSNDMIEHARSKANANISEPVKGVFELPVRRRFGQWPNSPSLGYSSNNGSLTKADQRNIPEGQHIFSTADTGAFEVAGQPNEATVEGQYVSPVSEDLTAANAATPRGLKLQVTDIMDIDTETASEVPVESNETGPPAPHSTSLPADLTPEEKKSLSNEGVGQSDSIITEQNPWGGLLQGATQFAARKPVVKASRKTSREENSTISGSDKQCVDERNQTTIKDKANPNTETPTKDYNVEMADNKPTLSVEGTNPVVEKLPVPAEIKDSIAKRTRTRKASAKLDDPAEIPSGKITPRRTRSMKRNVSETTQGSVDDSPPSGQKRSKSSQPTPTQRVLRTRSATKEKDTKKK